MELTRQKRNREPRRRDRKALSSDKRLALFSRLLAKARGGQTNKNAIPRRQNGVALPLSFEEERLWLMDQLGGDGAAFSIPAVTRLSGHLDADALSRALNEIVRRHESLRTSFVTEGGEPRRVISPAHDRRLETLDLSRLPDHDRERQCRRLIVHEMKSPFDLKRGPLFRSRLLRLGETDHVLILDVHHIVADGWSIGVLTRELTTLYKDFLQSKPASLAEPTVQYADFAIWQRQYLQGEVLERHLSYWRNHLSGSLPELSLPTDRPRPESWTYKGRHHRLEFSDSLSDRARGLAVKEGVTLYACLLASFNILLAYLSGQDDIVVGAPTANRNRTEVHDLIGFFVNTLPLRTDLWLDQSWGGGVSVVLSVPGLRREDTYR